MMRRFLLTLWPPVLLAVLLGACAGYLITFGGEPQYVCRVTLYVAPPASSSPTDAVMGDQYAANRTQLYLRIAQSNELAQRVAAQLQSSESPESLAARIKPSGSYDTSLLMIDATGPTPEAARELATAYRDQFPDFARTVEQGSGLREGPVVVPVTGPTDSTSTAWRTWLRVVIPAVACGLVALAIVLWYRRRHPRVGDRGALRRESGAFVERVTADPTSLARLRTLLLTRPGAVGTIAVVGARRADGVEDFVRALVADLRRAGIPHRHVQAGSLLVAADETNRSALTVVELPALLDDSAALVGLTGRPVDAVVIARERTTLTSDVVEVTSLLALNEIDVVAVVAVSRRAARTWRRTAEAPTPKTVPRPAENPWPRIEVLEDASRADQGLR